MNTCKLYMKEQSVTEPLGMEKEDSLDCGKTAGKTPFHQIVY